MDHHNDIIGIFDATGCLSERGLTLFAEGSLDASLQQKVKQHVEGCELCAAALEGWEMMLQQEPIPDMAAMMQSIRTDIDDKVMRAGKRRNVVSANRVIWISAAATIVILMGFYFLLRPDEKIMKEEIAQNIPKPALAPPAPKDSVLVTKEQEPHPRFIPPTITADYLVEESTNLAVMADSVVPGGFNTANAADVPATEEIVIANVEQKAVVEEKELVKKDEAPVFVEGIRTTKAPASGKRSKTSASQAPPPAPASVMTTQAEEEDKSPVFTVVEEMPAYPGGEEARLKFLQEHLQYPQKAKESGIQGTVYVSFLIDKKGKVKEVKVVRGIGGGCDEEAVRVVKLFPAWNSGKQAGKAVDVMFTMPVKFSLN